MISEKEIFDLINNRADWLESFDENRNFNREDIAVMFKTLMKEEGNRDYSPKLQESLIDNIFFRLINGYTKSEIISEFSDVKHMGYFEFTLGRKESNRLFNVLSELKIPTSILRGVRKDMPYDEVVDGYRIIQIMSEETAPGQSPEVVYFAIIDKKTGETIFESNGKTVENQISDFTDKFEDLKKKHALSKKSKSTLVDVFLTNKGVIRKIKIKNGAFRYIDENGRFVKWN